MSLRNVTCKTLPVQRSAGQSAVAGAAYRAGERLYDERQQRTADFSRRAPDVGASLILVPEHGNPDFQDRSTLWNAAEAAEKRKDGRPARDVQLGLAWELPVDLQREAVTEFARSEFVEKGHVVDIAFHRYGQRVLDISEEDKATIRRWAAHDVPFLEQEECDSLNAPHVKIERHADGQVAGYKIYQPHAHCYVTPRSVSGDGFASKRNRDLDKAETAKEWRYEWPRLQNSYLEAIGSDVRVTATAETPGIGAETLENHTYHMQQRGVEPISAQAEIEFNAVHNEAVRAAQSDMEGTTDSAEPTERQASRVAAWWRNMREHFHDWREDWRERAADTWDRFRGRKRAQTVDPDPPDTTVSGIDAAPLESKGQEQATPDYGDREPEP